MHIYRQDVEKPEDFLRNFAVGRELNVQRIVSVVVTSGMRTHTSERDYAGAVRAARSCVLGKLPVCP